MSAMVEIHGTGLIYAVSAEPTASRRITDIPMIHLIRTAVVMHVQEAHARQAVQSILTVLLVIHAIPLIMSVSHAIQTASRMIRVLTTDTAFANTATTETAPEAAAQHRYVMKRR